MVGAGIEEERGGVEGEIRDGGGAEADEEGYPLRPCSRSKILPVPGFTCCARFCKRSIGSCVEQRPIVWIIVSYFACGCCFGDVEDDDDKGEDGGGGIGLSAS